MTRIVATACVALSAALGAGSVSSAEEVRPLFTRELPNIPGKTVTVIEVNFAPHSQAAPHRHGQAFVYAYVLSGRVRSRLEGEAGHTYRIGQSWFEPPGAHHVLTQNISSTYARLLVVFVADTNATLKTPDDAPTPGTPAASRSH